MTLTRSRNGMIGGVAAGIAKSLNIDPTIVRIAFVLVSIFAGSGLLIYGILWIVIPKEGAPMAASLGPPPEMLAPNAPNASAACLTCAKPSMSGARRGSTNTSDRPARTSAASPRSQPSSTCARLALCITN